MPLSDNTRGALLMMFSMAAFTLNDTFMKSLAGQVPLFQVLVLRGVLTTVLVGGLAWRMGALHTRIPRKDRRLIGWRMVGEIGAAYFFLTALFNMPLANVTAILSFVPLAVTLCAALFLKEPLGWRRMTAILVGLGGVLLIVRPGAEGFNIFSVYVLISVGFIVVRDLSTRQLSGDTHSMLVTFTTTVSVTLFFGVASVTEDWAPVNGGQVLAIIAAAGMVMLGYVFSVMVMRVGEISAVAPFRYTSLIWALVLGWFVFGDWPRPLTLIGAAIVVGSGVFTLYRERQLARRAARSRVQG